MHAGKVCAVGRTGVSIIIRECRCFVIVGATHETDDALDDFGDELCVFDDEIGETDNEMVETGDAMDETGDAVGDLRMLCMKSMML